MSGQGFGADIDGNRHRAGCASCVVGGEQTFARNYAQQSQWIGGPPSRLGWQGAVDATSVCSRVCSWSR